MSEISTEGRGRMCSPLAPALELLLLCLKAGSAHVEQPAGQPPRHASTSPPDSSGTASSGCSTSPAKPPPRSYPSSMPPCKCKPLPEEERWRAHAAGDFARRRVGLFTGQKPGNPDSTAMSRCCAKALDSRPRIPHSPTGLTLETMRQIIGMTAVRAAAAATHVAT